MSEQKRRSSQVHKSTESINIQSPNLYDNEICQQSEDDLLLRCKIAILDLTESLDKQRSKVAELEQKLKENESLKARNQMLEEQRKLYIKENVLLRYFIANLDSNTTSPPINIKPQVNPEQRIQSHIIYKEPLNTIETPQKSDRATTARRNFSTQRKYRYLL